MKKFKITFGFIFSHPLSSRHLFRAFARLFFWQIQFRLSRELIVKKFIADIKFYAKRGLTGVSGNIYGGLHEFFDMGFLLHYLREEDTFYDVGANVGTYTLLASGVCKAKSYSIEPIASTFALLDKNIGLNSLAARVQLVHGGAGSKAGILTFSADEDTTNHVMAAGEKMGKVVEVPVITVDSLLEDAGPALIKIDVEGFETEVLNGMQQTLLAPNLNAIIIELNGSGERYGFNEQNIHELLLSYHFKAYHYDPFERNLRLIDSFGSHNTIYCRNLEKVLQRLKTADKFRVMGEGI